MMLRLAFIGIAVVGAIVSLPSIRVYAYDVVAQVPMSTPTPPLVIPAWVLGGGWFYHGQQATPPPSPDLYDVDPGATADQNLFAGVLDAGPLDTALESNCPGVYSTGNASHCNPYLYINMLNLLCDGTLLSSNAYMAMNTPANEQAFLHDYAYPSPTPTASPGPRSTDGGDCPTPDVSPTPSATASAGYYMNPDPVSTGFYSWLQSNAWTTSTFPTPFGIYEDHFSVTGEPCYNSYEYGRQACNVQGNSNSPDPNDWETALGDFQKNAEPCSTPACFPFVGNGLTPGGGANTPPCSTVVSPHCWATPEAGVVDDMDALDNVCSAADSGDNLRAIAAEEIVFIKGTPAPSGNPRVPSFADTQTIVYMINTMSHLVNYTSGACKNMVAVDVEAGGGSFYPLNNTTPGTVSGGIPVRMEATAMRFLVPNPQTLVPDRMQPLYFTIGGTNNNWTPSSDMCTSSPYCEIPYMFEETLVPQGPEVSVGAFTWNGSTPSPGDGCPANGDTGGAVDLKVDCVSGDSDYGAAVFKQQYKHLYIDGVDYGPAAVMLNTASTTTVTIQSAWFSCSGCDSIGTYNYQLAMSTGELTTVAYSAVSGGSISITDCTETTFCNGDDSVSGNTATFNPSAVNTIGPHSGVILLKSN
jgi:hypothetical protein